MVVYKYILLLTYQRQQRLIIVSKTINGIGGIKEGFLATDCSLTGSIPIPIGDSDFSFVPCSRHVEHFFFS